MDHLDLMQILPVVGEVDLLIFLVGINDLAPTLAYAGGSTKEAVEADTLRFRKQVFNGERRLRPSRPYFKHTEIFELTKRSSAVLLERFSPSSGLRWIGVGPGSYMAEKRQQRSEANRAALPDLSVDLEEYGAVSGRSTRNAGAWPFVACSLLSP